MLFGDAVSKRGRIMNRLEKILEKLIGFSKKSREWRSFVFSLAAILHYC